MDSSTLAGLLRAKGARVFRDDSSYPAPRAERALSGLSHYFSLETRKFFGSRVLDCKILDSGLILGVVESVKPPSGRRMFKAEFFDIFGTCLLGLANDASKHPAGFENYRCTHAAALKLFWHKANQIDAVAVTLEALASEARAAETTAADYREIIATAATAGEG
jgi:hypothetical protein